VSDGRRDGGGITITNTLTRRKEAFAPRVPGEVGMYVCGVTVYDLSHIGHARSALVFDVIRRYLAFKGHRVTFVRNYTDVDDKIIRRAHAEGVPAREVSERYIAAEREDMASLGLLRPDVEPKATDHIPEMIALIERLIATGIAYVVDGDVYFEIARFPRYGQLSGKHLDELMAGARVDVDARKRDPRDFALWKTAKPGEPSWASPWGEGRPGWHIECSAMAMHYLGESFDIHGGGDDLIFPHHECEIAQAEAATGRTFSRYWLHNALLNMGKDKMSKSLGNTLTIRDLVKRHDPEALRLYLLGTHYRHPIEWSEERVHESARALDRFRRLLLDGGPSRRPASSDAGVPAEIATLGARFEAAMDDDFNTAQALAALFDLSRVLHEHRDRGASADVRSTLAAGVAELRRLGGVLGLFQGMAAAEGPPPRVLELVEARAQARRQRRWQQADEIRDEIHRAGWSVEDTAAGPRITPRGR
jgi:cysteinyl-tRNA synthetase